MKTFEEKDLITWSNRDKAVLGNKYYFAHTLIGLQNVLKSSSYIETLKEIDENDISSPFSYYDHEEGYICNFACILPAEAVKDIEPKKYRTCKTIQELCKLVTGNTSIQSDEQCSLYLVGCKIHIRNKSSNGESYLAISGIYIYDYEIAIKLDSVSYCFNDLFETYEIEINGKWQPFGVLED